MQTIDRTGPDEPVAILFADLCGSTRLYSDTTDEFALGAVAASLDAGSRFVIERRGSVIRSKGDDLLCTFARCADALNAARDLAAWHQEATLDMRIGLHIGPIIEARGDIFGDAVNVAARLLELAEPGETLASGAFAQHFSGEQRHEFRSLGHYTVKGKSEPLEVYGIARPHVDETTLRTQVGAADLANAPASVSLAVTWEGRRRVFESSGAPVVLGRASHCDIIVNHPKVSRAHASIDLGRGKATLSDRSTAGTWVSSQGSEVLLRRESMVLVGRGVISLTGRPSGPDATLLMFEHLTD